MGELIPLFTEIKNQPKTTPDDNASGVMTEGAIVHYLENEQTVEEFGPDDLGNIATRTVVEVSKKPDKVQDSLGGGIRQSDPEELQGDRKKDLAEFIGFNEEFREYVEAKGFSGLFSRIDGMSYVKATETIQSLVENSSGSRTKDLPAYIRTIKPSKGSELKSVEKAEMILQCNGLGILEESLKIHRNGDPSRASSEALRKIGGNLHTHTDPGGAVEIFEGVIELANDLLKTYTVYRTKDRKREPTSDPVTVIQTLRRDIARTAGIKQYFNISRDEIRAAHAVVIGNTPPENTAA